MSSKVPIPTPLRYGTTLFDYVGAIDGESSFRYTSIGTSEIMSHGKYSGGTTFYDFVNSYIIIKNKKANYIQAPIPMIRVDGVFDKPMDVAAFNCKLGQQCDFWNEPYPATGDMIQMIIQYIIQVDYGKDKDRNVSNMPEVEVNPLAPRNVLP